MKYLKYVVIILSGVLLMYFLLRYYLFDKYIYGLNNFRRMNNIEIVNPEYTSTKEINTYIFSDDDASSPFSYKMVEFKMGLLYLPVLVSELDVYESTKLKNAELTCVYTWNNGFFKKAVNKEFFRYTYVSDSIELPDGSYTYLKKTVFIREYEADSILSLW